MKDRRWVVRVVVWEDQTQMFDNPFLECLRYAGLVVVHNDRCFDVLPPNGMVASITGTWSKMNAERMTSMGFNAVSAPEWRAGDEVTPR